MESPSVNLEDRASHTLESTVELPILQRAARNTVDIYLPQPVEDWDGPALQEPLPRIEREHFEDHVPLQGMLRAVDTTFSPQSERETTDLVTNYARRSAKRGLVYTLLFLAFISGAAIWTYLNFDALLLIVFEGFK